MSQENIAPYSIGWCQVKTMAGPDRNCLMGKVLHWSQEDTENHGIFWHGQSEALFTPGNVLKLVKNIVKCVQSDRLI